MSRTAGFANSEVIPQSLPCFLPAREAALGPAPPTSPQSPQRRPRGLHPRRHGSSQGRAAEGAPGSPRPRPRPPFSFLPPFFSLPSAAGRPLPRPSGPVTGREHGERAVATPPGAREDRGGEVRGPAAAPGGTTTQQDRPPLIHPVPKKRGRGVKLCLVFY